MNDALKRCSTLLLKPELLFVTLALPFGIVSAIMVPQLSVADENNHFLKAYNLASGSIGNQNCRYPNEVYDKATATYDDQFSADYAEEANLSNVSVHTCGSAASYTPIMHIPQAVGILLAKLAYPSTGLMVLMGRLTNLLFFVVVMYYIIKHARISKWVLVVIGLLPLSIHSAASLSADVMNNIVVLGFMTFLFNLVLQADKISKKQTVALIILSGLLSLTKVTNIVLLLPLLFLPTRLFVKNSIKGLPFNLQKWGLAALCGALGLLIIVCWQKIYGAPLAGAAHNTLLTNNPLYFINILANTYINPFIGYGNAVIDGIVGGFSSYKYNLPLFVTLLCYGIFLVVFLYKDKDEDRASRSISQPFVIGSLGALCLLVLAVTYAMYTTWATMPVILGPDATYAAGVQGRYFTAALILLAPFFIWLRRYIHFETNSPKLLGVIVFLASTFWLLFYTVETYRFIS